MNEIDYQTLKEKQLIENNKDEWTVYYNNTPSTQYIVNSQNVDIKLADEENCATGTSSKNGAMIYKDGGSSQKYGAGDNTALDIWADCYIKVKDEITITVIDQPAIQATVSFVGQNGNETLIGSGYDGSHDTYFKKATDALITDETKKSKPEVKEDNHNAGGTDYGNTIATSFTANIVNKGSTSWNNIVWTVTIPDPTESPVFVKKIGNEDMPLSKAFTFEGTAKLTDTDDVDDSHEGAIYKANGFNTSGSNIDPKSISFTAYDDISTTITTSGEVIYGFVIDNLYAPGATATVTYNSTFDNNNNNMANVTDDTHAEGYDDYSDKVNKPADNEE